jgi:hypothetical protein
MKTVEVVGIGCQDLPVNAFSVRQLPRPMVSHSSLKKLHLRHDGRMLASLNQRVRQPALRSASTIGDHRVSPQIAR